MSHDGGGVQQPAVSPQHALLQSTAAGFEGARCAAQHQITACWLMNAALNIFWQAVRGQLLLGRLGRTLANEQLMYINRQNCCRF